MDGGRRVAQPLNWIARLRAGRDQALPPSRLRRTAQRCWIALLKTHVPRGAGVAATAAVVLATLGYGMVKGDHVPTVIAALKDARDQLAQAAGFRIVSLALSGEHHISREEVLALAGVTDRSALLVPRRRRNARSAQDQSLDRRCHRAQALPRRAADPAQGARGLCALAAGRTGLRHRRRWDRAGALSRPAACGNCRSSSAVAPMRRPRIF